MTEVPDPDRLAADWQTLSTFRDPDQPGWTRRPFTPPYAAARAWLAEQMQRAGLATRVDGGGNLVGARPGTRPDLPSIVLGSHTDTVSGGGRFDGIIGVLSAIEVARCVGELRHPLEVIDFLAEEPTDFGISTIGSRALAGTLTPEMLALEHDGLSLAQAIASVGGQPDSIGDTARSAGSIALYLELHIEQGGVLENARQRLGVVTGITGIARFRVDVVGQADHAGTMPMGLRHDALCTAADVVLGVERMWQDGLGVGTVGRLFVSPNATNVVPGAVSLWVEMRSVDGSVLDERRSAFAPLVNSIAAQRGLFAEVTPLSYEAPVPVADDVQSMLSSVVEGLGQPVRRLASYAGHDANQMAKIAPIGMLFVPSRSGRSHCPEEWTELTDVALGAQALLSAVVRADSSL